MKTFTPEEINKFIENLHELRILRTIYRRAFKLMEKHKTFIVIAVDEPYFIKAYEMIKEEETKKKTWTGMDEWYFNEACKEKG